MSGVAERELTGPAGGNPLSRASGVLLDRLFAPHGPSAYFRWVAPGRTDRGAAAGPAAAPPRVAPTSSTVIPEPAAEPVADPATGPDGAGGRISFVRSGLTAVAEGTLLETAEAAGLSPRFRCRRGICGTCTTDKREGTVRDIRTGEVSDAAGPVRICVSEPCGDVALDL